MNVMTTLVLTIKNALFLSALILPVVPALLLVTSVKRNGIQYRRNLLIVGLFCISLAFNPLVQAFILEPLDTKRNYDYAKRAQHAALLGKNPSQVEAIFGNPEYTWTQSPSSGETGYICWEYKPLPGYWLGSHFQIFFVNGKVRNFEANDD